MQTFANLFFISLFLIINSVIQVLFKTIALGPGGSSYIALFIDPLFYLCGVLFIALAVVWMAVLRRMPLSKAYPFTSLNVVLLLVSGALFFGEKITYGNILGGLLIMIGVATITSENNTASAGNKNPTSG